MAFEELRHRKGIIAVSLNAQAKRFDAEPDKLSGIRRKGRPEVAQTLCEHTRREGSDGRGVSPHSAMIRLVRFGQRREFARNGGPIELARVHNGTANRSAVSTKPLGKALDYNRDPVLSRAIQVRRCEGIVYDNRKVERCGCLHERWHIGNVNARIANGFGVPKLRARCGRGHKGIDVVVGNKCRLYAEVVKGVQENVPRPAIK